MTTRGSTRLLALALAALSVCAACGGDDDEPADAGASASGSLDDAGLQAACDDLADEVSAATDRGDTILQEEFGTADPAPDAEFGDRHEDIVEVLGVVLLSAGDVLDLVEDWEGAERIAGDLASAQEAHAQVEGAFEDFEESASPSSTFNDLFLSLQESGAPQSYGRPVIEAVDEAGIDCDPF